MFLLVVSFVQVSVLLRTFGPNGAGKGKGHESLFGLYASCSWMWLSDVLGC